MKRQAGFTLIELVVVIIILGILAATALPKFMNVQDQAHQAAVAGVAGSLGSGVSMVHAQWMANGGSGASTDVNGFGANDVDVNASGWPVGTDDGNSIGDADDCVDLWNGVLRNPPKAATSGGDYTATANAGDNTCTFAYNGDNAGRRIVYDADDGSLTVTNP